MFVIVPRRVVLLTTGSGVPGIFAINDGNLESEWDLAHLFSCFPATGFGRLLLTSSGYCFGILHVNDFAPLCVLLACHGGHGGGSNQ